MNCESAVKLVPLYFYGELAPDEEDGIEQHLDTCVACGAEARRYRDLCTALAGRQVGPSTALLAECRHDLMLTIHRNEALAIPHERQAGAPRLRFGLADWFSPLLRWRMPLGATALMAIGFLAARLTTPGAASPLSIASLTPENVMSSVRSVQPVAEGSRTGEIQIVLDETQRKVVYGHLNDSNIQRLMLSAAHDESNPALRVESVDLLKNHCDSSPVRSLLLNRVLEDPNPGVRLKALDGLRSFTADPEVRKVLAKVLLRDDNPGVRIQVVDALTSRADANMVGVLQNVVQSEDNSYVRRRCEKALKDMNASIGTF
jgi:hypothetical protein